MARAAYLGPEARRPLVLDAAARLFARGGYRATTMRAIAAECGVSKTVLYACFPGGKRELHRALIERATARFRHVIRTTSNTRGPEDAVNAALVSFARFAEEDAASLRLLFGDPGTADAIVLARARRMRETLLDRFASAIRRSAGGGIAGAEVSVVVAGVALELARRRAKGGRVPSPKRITSVLLNGLQAVEATA